MGEEERRRKQIIDSARAMARAVGCMETTLYLFRRGETTAAMVQEFRARCETVARMAADIETACGADSEADG